MFFKEFKLTKRLIKAKLLLAALAIFPSVLLLKANKSSIAWSKCPWRNNSITFF